MIAWRDYTLTALIILPGFVLSSVSLTWYAARRSEMYEVMHTTIPAHLIKFLDVWTRWYLFLPWSALLPILCFGAFEVAVRIRNKALVRQILLIMVSLSVIIFCALTTWSVVDAQDQHNLQVFQKYYGKQGMKDGEKAQRER